MPYRENRSYENAEKVIYTTDSVYGIPSIPSIHYDGGVEKWIPFNYALTYKGDKSKTGVHFFIDDYQFNRVWKSPDNYIKALYEYRYVIAPDFSLYTDFPIAMQIWNTFRRQWMARYWQEHYINIIPCGCWSTEESYKFCFDGMPMYSAIAISTQGACNSAEKKKLFIAGYNEMIERLQPTELIVYGELPEEVETKNAHVIFITTYANQSFV